MISVRSNKLSFKYHIRLQRYRDYKIWVCGKDSFSLYSRLLHPAPSLTPLCFLIFPCTDQCTPLIHPSSPSLPLPFQTSWNLLQTFLSILLLLLRGTWRRVRMKRRIRIYSNRILTRSRKSNLEQWIKNRRNLLDTKQVYCL